MQSVWVVVLSLATIVLRLQTTRRVRVSSWTYTVKLTQRTVLDRGFRTIENKATRAQTDRDH